MSDNSSTVSISSSSRTKRHRKTLKYWFPALLVAVGIQPAISELVTADSVSTARAEESLQQKRQRILEAIPKDPSVLINIDTELMPVSPDVLNLGRRAEPALEQCLANNTNPYNRSECAVMLNALGDRRALPSLRTALADWNSRVRLEAIRALEAIPDPASYDSLAKLFLREDEPRVNRVMALIALGAISSPKAVRLLRRVAVTKPKDDKAPDFRPTAFQALWRSRHLMSPATFATDVNRALRSDDNTQLVLSAIEAASILRNPQHVAALIPLMNNRNEEIRNKAVYALGKIGDKRATAALLDKLPDVREARMLNNIAFALERLDDTKFFESINKLLEHKQAIIRVNAAFVVGDVKRPEGKDLLVKALKDPSNLVRVNAIVALGKLAAPHSAELLRPYTKSDNREIRQEAIFALQKLGKDSGNELLRTLYWDKKHPDVRQRAAAILAKRHDPLVLPFVLQRCLEWQQCSPEVTDDYLRTNGSAQLPGRVLLTWSSQQRPELNSLLAHLHPKGTETIARSKLDRAISYDNTDQLVVSLDLLAKLHAKDPRVVQTIKQRLLTDKQAWIRIVAGVTLLELGDESAMEALWQDIQNLPSEQLPSLVRLLSKVNAPKARETLLSKLLDYEKSKDTDFAMAAAAVHLAWNPEKAIFRFLDALGSRNTRETELAQHYIGRNHSKTVTSLLRRALARERRPYVKQHLRSLLDKRAG